MAAHVGRAKWTWFDFALGARLLNLLVRLYWRMRASRTLQYALAPTYRRIRYNPRAKRIFGPTYRRLRAYALAGSSPNTSLAAISDHSSSTSNADLSDVRAVLSALQQENQRLAQRQDALAQQIAGLDQLMQRNFAVTYLQLLGEPDRPSPSGHAE